MDIDQAYWNNQNHLYAVSQNGGRLFVFTVTPTSASQASGSPYVINHPRQMIVQPKTLRGVQRGSWVSALLGSVYWTVMVR
jgi:hypothetical protein